MAHVIYERGEFMVPTEILGKWATAFPGVDVRQELLKAAVWAAANPPKKNWHRFLANWMIRVSRETPKPTPAPVKIRPAILDEPPPFSENGDDLSVIFTSIHAVAAGKKI